MNLNSTHQEIAVSPGRNRMARVQRRISNWLWGNTLVLVYHRVAKVDADPFSVFVSPQNFAGHLDVLRSMGTIVPALQIERHVSRSVYSGLKFVITFDDGYADNFETALPLLRKYDVPATFFVTAADSIKPFWWDILQAVFLTTDTLPQKFSIQTGGLLYDIDLKSDYHLREETRAACKDWRLGSITYPTMRHEWLKMLAGRLKTLKVSRRNELLLSLVQATGTDYLLEKSETASPETLKAVAGDERCEIGSHTVNHICLSGMSIEEQAYEIVESKKRLEDRLQRQVLSFAFPHGGPADYTEDSVRLAAEAGYSRAFTCRPVPLNRKLDPFQIPRISIGNQDAASFRNYLLQVLKRAS